MKILLWSILIYPLLTFGQSSQIKDNKAGNVKGIKFEYNLSWEQIKAKAKLENKYIFIDCYATWCIPCKLMDRKIFSSETVGDYMDKLFVSVKVQMDSTSNDAQYIKDWYNMAKHLKTKYRVKNLPTFLFFSPMGEALHKATGAPENVESFLALLTDACNPDKQYYTLINRLKNDTTNLDLANKTFRSAQRIGDNEISKKAADIIVKNATIEYLYTPENLLILAYNTLKSTDRGFNIFYENEDLIDSLLKRPGYSVQIIQRIIYNENYVPLFERSEKQRITPDWNFLYTSLKKKYPKNKEYYDRVVLEGRTAYYRYKEDWREYTKAIAELFNKYYYTNTPLNSFALNNAAWEIFLYSDNKDEIESAISWMEKIVVREGNATAEDLDTYANLLYKSGNRDLAIKWEKNAVELNPIEKLFRETLAKMEEGKPTWPIR